MRYLLLSILSLGLVSLYSCGGEDPEITADFSFTLVDGTTYTFQVTTPEYTSAEWTLDGTTYNEPTFEHTFSEEGTFDVTLKVTLEHDKGEAVSEVTKAVSVATQFETLKVNTKFGDFYIYLYQTTPLHKANIIKLAEEGYYDGTTFHRIIKNFVIQGGDPNSKDGDPNNDGTGGPGYRIPAEIKPNLKHIFGAIGAARQSTTTESNGSQFYVVENPGGTPHLDGQYTVFGIVFSGMDVVSTIASQAKSANDRPINDITMEVDLVWYSASELKNQYDFEIPSE